MKKHFVTFYSPGTFVAEATEQPIDSWDIEKAKAMAQEVVERYGATPYGFVFSTRERQPDDLDSKVIETSGVYYINCVILTAADLLGDENKILRQNMSVKGWDKVVQTTSGWRWTQPLRDGDIVL